MWRTNQGDIIEGQETERFIDHHKIKIINLSPKEYEHIIDTEMRIRTKKNYHIGLVYEIVTYRWKKEEDRKKIENIQFPTVIEDMILEYMNVDNIKVLIQINNSKPKVLTMVIRFKQKKTTCISSFKNIIKNNHSFNFNPTVTTNNSIKIYFNNSVTFLDIGFDHLDNFTKNLQEIMCDDYIFNKILHDPNNNYVKIHIKQDIDVSEFIKKIREDHFKICDEKHFRPRFATIQENNKKIKEQKDGDYLIIFTRSWEILFVIMLKDLRKIVSELKFVQECLKEYNL